MNDSQIDDAVREMARRWYFNGSLDGGLGRDTDEAEKRHVDIHATIKQMALFGTALASRVRDAEQERCNLTASEWEMLDRVFMPMNPNKLRKAHPEVVALAKKVKGIAAAIRAPRTEREA